MTQRIRSCGRRYAPQVEVHAGDRGVHLRGLITCGSVWACPCCAPRIAAQRADTIKAAVGRWLESGGVAYLLTLTVRHGWTDDGRETLAGVARAFRRMCQGEPWRRWQTAGAVGGYVRAVELTHGPNGWHPHAHVLVLTRDASELEGTRAWLADRWRTAVVRELGEAHAPGDHGLDLRATDACAYVAKLGLELAGGGGKEAAPGHRAPWQIAADVAEHGRPADVALWQDYQRASWGRRQLTWSAGARALAGAEADATDEQLAEAAEREPSTAIATLTPDEWRIVQAVPDGPAALLEGAEAGGARGVALTLAALITAAARRYGRAPPN